ncbi:hypothetical protein K4F52_003094 [Lecanicillium sp. MT-2017a]|nr:hypothetical protein K4F52_003094 [Lecanicillium sp. MT-2017a]
MRFHVAAAALLGMITTAVADVSKLDSIHTPEKDSKVKVGTTEDIKWTIDAEEYTDAKINIAVLGGKDQDHLQVIGNIATNVDNSDLSYSWEVKPTLDGVKLGKEKQYGIRIALADDETVYQYSPRFTIVAKDGDDEDSTSSASSSSATAASTTSKASKTSSAAEETSTESSKKTVSADKSSTTMAVTTSSAAQSGAATSGATPSPSTSPTTTPDSAAAQVGACAVGALGAVAVALFAM